MSEGGREGGGRVGWRDRERKRKRARQAETEGKESEHQSVFIDNAISGESVFMTVPVSRWYHVRSW